MGLLSTDASGSKMPHLRAIRFEPNVFMMASSYKASWTRYYDRFMRAIVCLATFVLGACVSGVAYAGGPSDVYNEFAQHGKLSCNHSRRDLQAVLRSVRSTSTATRTRSPG
jgi:hypothetical protein